MEPTPTAPRRQSCDRCHGQKLRCTRTGNSETGACNRCLRHGAQCVYSFSLPKGRPSMYRLADTSTTAPSNPSAMTTASATPDETRQQRAHTATADPKRKANGNTKSNSGSSPKPISNSNSNANVNVNANVNPNTTSNVIEDPIMAECMDTSGSAWPWLAPLSWNDMQINGTEQDPNPSLHTIVNPQIDGGAAFLDAFPSLLNWGCIGNEAFQGHGTEFSEGSSSSSSNNSSTSINSAMEKNGPDVAIAQLSQLSTRLYTLHSSTSTMAENSRSSCGLRDPNQVHLGSLIDDAAFKSVAAWLVHVSSNMNFLYRVDGQNPGLDAATTGDTLHDAFSASHHLLQILRCLQLDMGSGTSSSGSISTPTSSGGGQLGFWTPQSMAGSSESTSLFEQVKGSSSYGRASSQHSNTVVRHLIIACHTLLLNIYVAVLIALQHDVDMRVSSFAGNGDADTYMDGAALADIRLVLVVQLCSYLVERQYQAVTVYLSSQSPPPSSSSSSSSSQQHDLPGSTSPNSEVRGELEMEVQQRLAHLRQTLRI
ncbi:hypothetical protein AJ80_03304 [Polytolypa hystricis UAMH7299]|uniref:Zn(2)-C6 fungal-type domain-containing protein n=1 Tax=Polytolypa hystricis (strain UAMH7299) TaxID=1447883 RepID=A0A2B7YLA2_POLH7|nr:hypothetical protein AJ80_03304 [Polytolypa hystricis UAMH7299]